METIISEAQEYAENIVQTVQEPLIIMDGNLKVMSANKSFYSTFKVDAKETVGDFIYKLGNGQWNIPELKKQLTEIITKKDDLVNFRIDHIFENIGHKIMILNAKRVPPTPAKPRIILLAIEDVTKRVSMEEQITEGLKTKVSTGETKLALSNKKLKEKIDELEIFNRAAVGREITLRALKNETISLRKKLAEK